MAITFTEARKQLSINTEKLIDLMESLGGHATMTAEFPKINDGIVKTILRYHHRSPISNAKLKALLQGMDHYVKEVRETEGEKFDVLFYRDKSKTIEIDDDLFEEIKKKLGIQDDKGENPAIETDQLIDRPKADGDKPLTTNERRTLLIIIAALCDEAKIKPSQRGTAKRIQEMTERIGAPITENTIKNKLDEVPEALESRMK